MKSKPQILFIHGGTTFKSRRDYLRFLRTREISIGKKLRWHETYLDEQLGKHCEIIRPRMPAPEQSVYNDWRVHFERHFPYLRNNIVLIGISLGGIFLAKYLSENIFPKKILAAYLICPPFDNSLPGEDLVGGFKLAHDLSLMEKNCGCLTLMFSGDDRTVPAEHAAKYARRLKKAKIVIYESKNGHFKVPEFPELVKMIRENLKNKEHR